MKKLIVAVLLPHLIIAQNVKTLKLQADTLRKYGNERKSKKLYNKALNRILTYQERVTDYQWLSLSVAAHENELKLGKKVKPYICEQYGNNGIVLKEKIRKLTAQHIKYFTYYEWLGMTAITQMVRDTVSGQYIGFHLNNNRLLVWVTGKDVHFQQFSSSNVYKPLVIHNDSLRNLLIQHGEEIAHENLAKLRFKVSEQPFAVFEFRNGAEITEQRLADPKYLTNPEAYKDTYLSKLFPLIWNELRLYRTKVIVGI